MTSNRENSEVDPREPIRQPVLALLDRQWAAKKLGEPISPDDWQKLHPDGADGIADLHLLDALYDAACAIKEDSQVLDEPEKDENPDLASEAAGDTSTFEWRLPSDNLRESLDDTQDVQKACAAATHSWPGQPNVGDTIGSYLIKERLGRGGQASAFKAWDADTRRHVVLKIYHGAETAEQQEAVIEEGRKLAKVRSHYVPCCYHIGRFNGVPYLVLEYITGQNLSTLHRSRPLNISRSLDLVAKIADGLAVVHASGLLHRDIKPGNIMVGDDDVPRLVDFGLAKPVGDRALGNVSGTFEYMAPEQARGDAERIDPRTDIFGLGATLYFLLTGHAPYAGETTQEVRRAACEGNIVPPRQRNPKVSYDVSKLCMRCLAKTSEDRFDSARELSKHIGRRRLIKRSLIATMSAVFAVAGLLVMAILSGNTDAPSQNNGKAFDVAPVDPLPPLRIEFVKFQQLVLNKDGNYERWGWEALQEDPYRLRFDDAVKFHAKLSRPAYCFWIAFRPDGVEELCLPEARNEPPPLTDEPAYLADDAEHAFVLSDAVGLQAFVLVVSESPLPAYDEWLKKLPESPWRAQPEAGSIIRRHDGSSEEVYDIYQVGPTRGSREPVREKPSPLAELVKWIRNSQDPPPIVEAWGLPVRPRENLLTQ